MLEHLTFHAVGPANDMHWPLSPRMNFLSGDNGLGKSFMLEVAWWALTRTWARELVVPRLPPATPTIGYAYGTRTRGTYEYTSDFDRERERWSVKASRPPIPGMVLYAQSDGAFSAWDPARNYWKKDQPDRPNSYLFDAEAIWKGNDLCEGLIRDWASWQREDGAAFGQLKAVLRQLSPSKTEPLEPGELRKVSLADPKRYPTLRMPYGEDVPVSYASAGMRRIVALAYLLVWTWQEHLEASKLRGDAPAREIIFLIDEIEAHLHPQWQRRIVPALLEVMQALTGDHDVKVQLVIVTHSPLVMASVEPVFEPERDGLYLFEMHAAEPGVELPNQTAEVKLEQLAWSKQGDVVNWLVSRAFGLDQGRSVEAERAIEAAEAWMRGEASALPDQLTSAEEIHRELQRVLAGHDAFWPRWVVWTEQAAL